LRLAALKKQATRAGARAKAFYDFYNAFTVACNTAKTNAESAVSTHATKVTDCETKITDATTAIDNAVVLCKRRRYQEALTALEDFTKEEQAATATSATEKTKYDGLATAAKKTDCRKDAETGVRPECAEGQCCGQANIYEGDGTR